MISFKKDGNNIFLVYEPDQAEPNWVNRQMESEGEVSLRSQAFTLKGEDLYKFDDEGFGEEYIFHFAQKDNDSEYYKILGRRLGISHDIYFHQDIDIQTKYFVAQYNISIFKKIGNLIDGDLYIGGNNDNAVSKADFLALMKNFPNSYELQKYTDARLATVLGDYFSSASVANDKYNKYMNKRVTTHETDLTDTFKEIELIKFQSLFEKLTLMLGQPNAYNEKQWQTEILDIILLLFPKYVYAFENAVVKDDYKGKDRKLDLILVDAEGHVDVIEIKKPFDDAVVSSGKYRDNYVPKRELSGSIVQLEKYIFHLSKSGKKGEQKLTEQFKRKLPADFEIKITNPSGLVIVGRSNNLNAEQRADFEVIKRKYKNLLDIITYDDLLERLRRIIESWQKR